MTDEIMLARSGVFRRCVAITEPYLRMILVMWSPVIEQGYPYECDTSVYLSNL